MVHTITPGFFDFTDILDADSGAQETSNTIVVGNISTPVPISISSTLGTGTYSINGGAFTDANGSVSNGDTVALRIQAPGTGQSTVVTVTIGTVSDDWTVSVPGSAAAWPVQASGGAIHALPGVNLHGSNSYGGGGRAPGSTGVNIYLVDNLSDAETGGSVGGLGSNVFAGSRTFALRHNAGSRSKMIIPVISGTVRADPPRTLNFIGENGSYYGQFAPGTGLYSRGTHFNNGGNSDWQIWHAASYMGNDPGGLSDDARDPWSQGPDPNRTLFINCEFAWGLDEAFGGFNALRNMGFIYCAFIEPMVRQGAELHNFGPLLGGGGGFSENVSMERCFLAHSSDRNPFTSARTTYIANNIWYNIGRHPNGHGRGIHYNNQFGHNVECHHICCRNMGIRGPNATSTLSFAFTNGTWDFVSGSTVTMRGNAVHGWPMPSSQSGLIELNAANLNLSAVFQAFDAVPPGRDEDLEDLYRPFVTPAQATQLEKERFFELIEESVGMKPGHRSLSAGRLRFVLNQARARLFDGESSTDSQHIVGVNQPSWWSAAGVTINPLSPGSHWHDPLPTASNRHTPGSGTWKDEAWVPAAFRGQSYGGYTPMEAFAIHQHWWVGGK